MPKELGADRVTPENLDAALGHVRRCLDAALESGVKLDLTDVQGAELRQTLLADLEGFVRDEAASQVAFDPRRLEVGFGSERAAPELQRGLAIGDGLTLSGKIDRIDIDPFSARGIVQDYKSGAGAHSARDIDRELRLQIPLYLLVLRDLVGVEPLGGVYRALAGRRVTRGMLRSSAREDLPGFARDDYLDDDAFWAQVETARERAGEYAERIRAGDVRHDPKGDGCPDLVRPLAGLSGAPGMTDPRRADAAERRADRRRRGDRECLRLGRGGHRARPRCSSSGTCARCATADSTSSRSSSSRTRARRRASSAAASERRSSNEGATTWRAISTAPGSRRSTASATGS